MLDESLRYLIVFTGAVAIAWLFLLAPLRSMMLIVAFQKVIDIFWFIQVRIGPFKLSIQRLVYSLVPIVGLLVMLYEKNKRNLSLRMPAISGLMIAFALWFLVGVLRSPLTGENYTEAIERFMKVIAGFTMFGIGWYYLDNEKKYDQFAKLFIFTYLIAYAGVILQLTGIFKMEYIGVAQQTASMTGAEEVLGTEATARYPGFYNDGGTQAMYLFTAIPLSLYFIYKNEHRKWLYQLMFLICLSGVILSFVRGSWLTVILILFGWMLINKEFGKITVIIATGALLIVAGTIVGQFFQGFFRDVFASIEAGKLVGISGKAMRIEIIQDAYDQIPIIGKLFGEGVGANNLAIAAVTRRDFDSAETDFYGYLYDLGLLGWLLYYGIPATSLLIVWKNIHRCKPEIFGQALNLKYKVSFAMLIGSFFAYFGSGSKWVSFTFPLYFLLGFALKPPEFYLMKRLEEEENVLYLNPKLQPEYI